MWQWYYSGNWVSCTPENQTKLTQRDAQPSLEPLALTNPFGQLNGRLEADHMHYLMVGEVEETRTYVRKGPAANDCPIYAVVERSLQHVIPYEAGRSLFRDGTPSTSRIEVVVGTEVYVAHHGHLYRKMDGELQRVRWKKTDLSKHQYGKLTKSRFTWEFKGAFRWERIRAAVARVSSELDDSSALDEAFEQFDPELDLTEHGPYQFADFLVSRELHELAVRVMDAYHAAEPTEWQSFDPITNALIEKARREGRPLAHIMVRGHPYVLVFDSGSGASGQPPVVIRPLRYERILTSIEENTGRAQMRTLFDELAGMGIDARMFMLAAMTDDNAIDRLIPEEEARARIRALMTRSSMATALQNQLPPLLEKYKECDVRLSSSEILTPKPLATDIKQTLMTGLRVPAHLSQHCGSFGELMDFIHTNQAWGVGKGKHTCDICSAKTVVLGGHCGSAKACLKCWADSLHNTGMKCPFCRQDVESAQLCIVTTAPASAPRKKCKRKRRTEYGNAEEALARIHQDKLYAHFQLDDNEPMRKWFTVLMRSGMLKNGQLPRNMQAKKSLRTALHEFNILN